MFMDNTKDRSRNTAFVAIYPVRAESLVLGFLDAFRAKRRSDLAISPYETTTKVLELRT
jgi:hypothetical protein